MFLRFFVSVGGRLVLGTLGVFYACVVCFITCVSCVFGCVWFSVGLFAYVSVCPVDGVSLSLFVCVVRLLGLVV